MTCICTYRWVGGAGGRGAGCVSLCAHHYSLLSHCEKKVLHVTVDSMSDRVTIIPRPHRPLLPAAPAAAPAAAAAPAQAQAAVDRTFLPNTTRRRRPTVVNANVCHDVPRQYRSSPSLTSNGGSDSRVPRLQFGLRNFDCTAPQLCWCDRSRLSIRCSSITQNHTPASHREFPDSHWPIYRSRLSNTRPYRSTAADARARCARR